jgi:hypothetical protein
MTRVFDGSSRRVQALLLVSAIAAGCASYFPSGTIDPFLDDWYSSQLRATREEILKPTGGPRVVYRFTWIPSFHPTATVRVESTRGKASLVATRLDGAGGYDPGRVAARVELRLSADRWELLQSLLADAAFWDMPSEQGEKVDPVTGAIIIQADGDRWLLEGADAGRYHYVERQFHEDYPAFEAACFCMLRWSGLVADSELAAYLGDQRPDVDCRQEP